MADPKIKYDIEANVSGQGDIGQLASSVEKLAGTLDGDLKASALASAAALRELAQKDQAIANFVSLKREAGAAADSLKHAQGAAQTLGAQLAATENPTRSQTGALQKLRDAVQAAKTEVIAKSNALTAARTSLGTYGISTDDLSQKQIAVKQALGTVRSEVASHATAWQAAAAASANSSASQGRSHRVIKEGVDSISSQLKVMQGVYASLSTVQGLGSMVKDVAATADAYNNLQARIKLVTGEGAAFTTAFEGITAVAQRTSTSLESTGTLFAKLAEAGKAMGVGQADALKLTETVNQAVQLSGASAQASDAAVTQLIQGLQGGVLRGDEFNSVMEQSPRLAKALADGLGTTTGELRKMAEAGQLSSQTVIKALQGQSDAVASEFSKLPPTVGRALQNLSTSWTLYVGETDKATGASSAAATVISGLASHLKTMADYLIDAGQAAAAFAALRLAQHFAGIATSATVSATAVAANATAISAVGAAGTTAVASVGRFAAILSTLRTFTLVGVIANFKDIGTWIGEGIAKLNGYKDKTLELAAAEKRATEEAEANAAARKKQAAATKEAADRSFGLSKEASALVAKFDEMRTKGDSASDAIGKIGKDFDLSSIPGIRDAAAVLDELAADGKLSAQEFQDAWASALKGADLAVFETQARAAFAGTAREAERVAQVLDASLREAVKRTGLDMAVISGGMGKAATSAINDTESIIKGLDKLKVQGVDTAQVLTASIGKGINTADSQKAIDAVRLQIEAVRKVLGDKVADGLLDQTKKKAEELKDTLDKAKPGVNGLREAMKELGVVSDKTLKETAEKSKQAYDAMKATGTASTRELSDGFKAYAEKAIAANGGVASGALKLEAAVRGVTLAVDANGKATVSNAEKSKQAIEEVARAYIPWGEAAEKAAEREVAAREKVIAAREKEMQLLQRENQLIQEGIALENKRRGVDKDGFSADKSGQKIVGGSTLKSATGIMNFLKEAGIDDEAEVKRITNKYLDPDGTVTYANNRGQLEYGGDTVSMSLLHAAEQYTLHGGKERVKRENEEQAKQRAAEAAMRNGGQPVQNPTTPTATAEPAKTVNVRITLPDGSLKTVPTTQDGSYALIAALQSAKLSSGY